MQAANELTVFPEYLEHVRSEPRHQMHIGDNIRRIADFHPNLGHRRTDRAHAVGNDVHGPTGH